MTINSDLKQKEKEANRLHEREWQRQQTMQTIKGFLAVAIFISVIVLMSWAWAVE
jgi:hypothetical protein